MAAEKGGKKDKNQNIQVFVRLRPLNQRERDIKSLGVVEVQHNREVVVRLSQQSSHTKKFTFDRAFAPNAKQVEVYQEVVSPLIEEVLAGYNCTVFAYGQTGTGKTHTMVGESTGDGTTWQNDPLAGIIPRALSQLFDELRISNTEYTVRVSYLELYNEELFDLLSRSEDNSKLRIYEDVSRKGSNIVNGLEEFTVYNKNEVYKIMAQGQERKKVASTLMNSQSSRSHTVFTIVVHMKENSPEGEELVKIGKLNLVDLAGSENISKAGTDNPGKKDRARECVNINQSLLTLGRVITALVERHPHIPYRESKLTRILQESLGGRTKTSIIATVSPGHKDLEETMSTLEYANRAKNIQNKPEINQKMTKKEILKNYAEEIDRLRRDLQAARDKNGVYLATEDYTDMTLKNEEQRKEIQELLLKKRSMEEEKDKMENLFAEVNKTLKQRKSELDATKNQLISTKTQLATTKDMLRNTKQQCEEQAHLVEKHQATESTLSTQAQQLLATADVATNHIQCFHETIDKRRTVESINLEVTRSYREQCSQQRSQIQAAATNFTQALASDLNALHNALENFNAESTGSLQDSNKKLENVIQHISEALNVIKCLSSQSHQRLIEAIESNLVSVKSAVDAHHCSVRGATAGLVHSVAGCVRAAGDADVPATVAAGLTHWCTGASDRVVSLQKAHAAFESRMSDTESKKSEIVRKHRDARRANIERKNAKINAYIAEIEKEKAAMEKRYTEQLSDLETERHEAELRLQEERRLLDERLSKKAQELESARLAQNEHMTQMVSQYRALKDEYLEDEVLRDDELRETNQAGEDAIAGISNYGAEFHEGTVAITTDIESLRTNVVEVVQHVYSQLLQTLQQAHGQAENDAKSIVERDATTTSQFVQELDGTLARLASEAKLVLEQVVDGVESNNNATVSSLTGVSAANATVIAAAAVHNATLARELGALASKLTEYERYLSQAVTTQAELESRYLGEEYKLYSPTGKTPSRAVYRYPRQLAATSPHERILARFRAAALDDECYVVESDTESPAQGTDSETSYFSEDSAVIVDPAPPPPPPAARTPLVNGNHVGIYKSTSETDIYSIKRNQQQGKENADRLITYKKPSKLPAPASHKKPLVDHNV